MFIYREVQRRSDVRARLLYRAGAIPAGTLGAQYRYDFQDTTGAPNSGWTQIGSVDYAQNYGYSQGDSFPGTGSLIYNSQVPGANPNNYEIASELYITGGGGTYMHFLRASSYAYPNSGSYVSVELATPTTSGPVVTMNVQLNVNQRINNQLTQLASRQVVLNYGSRLRTIVFGSTLRVFLDGVWILDQQISLTTGQPGVGGYGMAGADIGQVGWQDVCEIQIGHLDTVAPNPINATGVASYVLPTSVSLQWLATTDDPNGTGVFRYDVTRTNGANTIALGGGPSPEFGDPTAAPATAYTYQIVAEDYHGNLSTALVLNVTTPPAGSIDSRRVGLQPTGSYWGGGGEQIDVRSGNLSFSIPIVQEQARNGWSLPVGLTYNSQNWRHDNTTGTDWQLGADT
ncbi:MAG TPA: hypothetical protein VEF06_05955, partial [Bryobacteraceae bacterium]|nr:hypothetical protein [Bryobacteraceae bacterium]